MQVSQSSFRVPVARWHARSEPGNRQYRQSHAKTSAWVLRVTLDVSLDGMASVASVRAHLISRRCLSESSPFVTYLGLVHAEAASSSALRTLSFSARQRFRCRNGLAPWYRRLRTHLAYPAGWSQGAHAGDGQEQPLSGFATPELAPPLVLYMGACTRD
jgi:hypothetical protein